LIDENEAWIEDNFTLKDSEKFRVMIKVYKNLFIDKEYFAKKIGVGRSTLFYWLQKERASFNTKSKTKICKGFKLIDRVWSDRFTTEYEFENSLSEYEKIEATKFKRDITKHTLIKLNNIKGNSMKLENLSKDEIDKLFQSKLKQKSAIFMFEFAQKLKSEKQIKEALEVLKWIDERENTFKYTHENRIRHLKAILLSHDSIKDYDGAIHILRSLYHSSHYHLQEPEILTLLASNYKRKALNCNSKEEIDMELITSALCLYEDAYELKPDNAKYYDAVNLAYLYNIVDAIEIEYANRQEIESLYRELLRVWRIDKNSWWEVCSDAEMLMLLGKVDLAILKISDFLESYHVEPFEIDTTIRQIKFYIHLTRDKNAKKFLDCFVGRTLD
jgi:tetratricopeptide (TPR) repeat protein